MPKQKWSSFEEARADVEAYNRNSYPLAKTKLVSLRSMGPRTCPSPAWDRDTQHQVALHGERAVIEKRLRGGEWVEAPVDSPVA